MHAGAAHVKNNNDMEFECKANNSINANKLKLLASVFTFFSETVPPQILVKYLRSRIIL